MDQGSLGELEREGPSAPVGSSIQPSLDEAVRVADALRSRLAEVILGAPEAVSAAVLAALTGTHLLIEDVPGVGKTMLAKTLAGALGVRLARVQGHPDLLPSDVTGVSVYSPDAGTWEFRPGPVFAHILLVDELNRTPPRTQSALLEAMAENQVTVDGESWALPRPHLVLATQNPLSQLGTFPLVESQLDRFGLSVSMGYPDEATEVSLALRHGGQQALDQLFPACDVSAWARAQWASASVRVAPAVASYAVRICRATRQAPGVLLGASPRAAIVLIRLAQAFAVMNGRDHTLPEDVKAVATACLAHRLVCETTSGVAAVRAVLASVCSPRP